MVLREHIAGRPDTGRNANEFKIYRRWEFSQLRREE